MIEYSDFSIVKFCKILQADGDHKKYGLSEEDWKSIKDQWEDDNITAFQKTVIEQNKKLLLAKMDLTKCGLIFTAASTEKQRWIEYSEFFKGRTFKNYDVFIKFLKTQVSKAKQKLSIYQAQLDKLLESQIIENEREVDHVKEITKALASFNLHGFTIVNNNDVTMGQFAAMTELVKDKNGKQ